MDLKAQIGSIVCAKRGHDWEAVGGRACPVTGDESGYGSPYMPHFCTQTVFVVTSPARRVDVLPQRSRYTRKRLGRWCVRSVGTGGLRCPGLMERGATMFRYCRKFGASGYYSPAIGCPRDGFVTRVEANDLAVTLRRKSYRARVLPYNNRFFVYSRY